MAWNLKWVADPLRSPNEDRADSTLLFARCDLTSLLSEGTRDDDNANIHTTNAAIMSHFRSAGYKARVALADRYARGIAKAAPHSILLLSTESPTIRTDHQVESRCHTYVIEPLHFIHSKRKYNVHRRKLSSRTVMTDLALPYVLERTDVWCTTNELFLNLRVIRTSCEHGDEGRSFMHESNRSFPENQGKETLINLENEIESFLHAVTLEVRPSILSHIANVLLQTHIRDVILPSTANTGGIAFIADGSILPRKSGISHSPMSSKHAIPFTTPKESQQLYRELLIDLGYFWNRHVCNFTVEKIARTTHSKMPPSNELREHEHFASSQDCHLQNDNFILKITGMIIPRGVTLICGGGFHGKSTLLRTIAMGVYDKVMNDGRELCVTIHDAISVRAEDGRYVHNCNISAFVSTSSSPYLLNIKNMPTDEACLSHGSTEHETCDSTSSSFVHDNMSNQSDQDSSANVAPEISRASSPSSPQLRDSESDSILSIVQNLFSTREASGSTSQASNVIEAIEFGVSALLIDEDVSAANFMARDGRMRAFVMDETITPLLYRVNGLYKTRNISSIIVVGGIGDWLDVPDAVILMDKHYMVRDALARAKSISHQFSYNHIQYAGRGVVHRLEWRKYDDGNDRKNYGESHSNKQANIIHVDDINPRDRYVTNADHFADGKIILLDGDAKICIHPSDDSIEKRDNTSAQTFVGNDSEENHGDEDDEDDIGVIDMTKCEQLIGKRMQALGCGIALKWMLRHSLRHPRLTIKRLLDTFDLAMNDEPGGNFAQIMMPKDFLALSVSSSKPSHAAESSMFAFDYLTVLESSGYVFRPRKFEIAMALTRMRGIKLEPTPLTDDEVEALVASTREKEKTKKTLAELWSNRRSSC